MFMQQLDEVADGGCLERLCGFGVRLGNLGELDHVFEEDFEIRDGAAEVDGLVQFADHGFVGGDQGADAFGEMVRVGVAEDAHDGFAIADGELDGEVVLGEVVLMLGEFGGDGGAGEDHVGD